MKSTVAFVVVFGAMLALNGSCSREDGSEKLVLPVEDGLILTFSDGRVFRGPPATIEAHEGIHPPVTIDVIARNETETWSGGFLVMAGEFINGKASIRLSPDDDYRGSYGSIGGNGSVGSGTVELDIGSTLIRGIISDDGGLSDGEFEAKFTFSCLAKPKPSEADSPSENGTNILYPDESFETEFCKDFRGIIEGR